MIVKELNLNLIHHWFKYGARLNDTALQKTWISFSKLSVYKLLKNKNNLYTIKLHHCNESNKYQSRIINKHKKLIWKLSSKSTLLRYQLIYLKQQLLLLTC